MASRISQHTAQLSPAMRVAHLKHSSTGFSGVTDYLRLLFRTMRARFHWSHHYTKSCWLRLCLFRTMRVRPIVNYWWMTTLRAICYLAQWGKRSTGRTFPAAWGVSQQLQDAKSSAGNIWPTKPLLKLIYSFSFSYFLGCIFFFYKQNTLVLLFFHIKVRYNIVIVLLIAQIMRHSTFLTTSGKEILGSIRANWFILHLCRRFLRKFELKDTKAL